MEEGVFCIKLISGTKSHHNREKSIIIWNVNFGVRFICQQNQIFARSTNQFVAKFDTKIDNGELQGNSFLEIYQQNI